jgi:hypothetical protein
MLYNKMNTYSGQARHCISAAVPDYYALPEKKVKGR